MAETSLIYTAGVSFSGAEPIRPLAMADTRSAKLEPITYAGSAEQQWPLCFDQSISQYTSIDSTAIHLQHDRLGCVIGLVGV